MHSPQPGLGPGFDSLQRVRGWTGWRSQASNHLHDPLGLAVRARIALQVLDEGISRLRAKAAAVPANAAAAAGAGAGKTPPR